MILGQVVGTVVATVKDPQLEGEKLLLVQLMNARREKIGRPLAAIEVVDAGVGDLVFLVRSREAALATYPVQAPVDLAIVGIVDSTQSIEDLDLELPFGETFFT